MFSADSAESQLPTINIAKNNIFHCWLLAFAKDILKLHLLPAKLNQTIKLNMSVVVHQHYNIW